MVPLATVATPREVVRLVGALPALILVLVGAGEILSASRYGQEAPSAAQWEQARGLLEAKHRPGELIVVAPGWLDPVGRQYLGQWMSVEMVARMDASRFSVIWEISAGGRSAPETRGLASTSSETFGQLRVSRFEQQVPELLFDFTSSLSAAQITGEPAVRPKLVLEEVGFEPHRCIRVEPKPGRQVVVRFPGISLGSKLVGYVGLADVFTRRDIRAPGTFEVRIDGQPATATEIGIDGGWQRFEVDTEPGRRDVEFISGASRPRRLICFAAEARNE